MIEHTNNVYLNSMCEECRLEQTCGEPAKVGRAR